MPEVASERLVKHFVEEDTVLRAYVFAATRSHHETDDILQTVWTVLWKKLAEYDETRPFRAWAFGVARLEVMKWRQRQVRSREYLSENTLELLADAALERASEIDLQGHFLEECLQKLTAVARRVLMLKYYRDMAIRSIAAKLGRSVAAVEMMLVRARRFMRQCVDQKTQQAVEQA
jgi:RNA polymerase sigma-70 factor, ECF subfamily